MWSLDLVTAPTALAVEVSQAKAHSRIDDPPFDAEADLIVKLKSAIADCENFTERQLLTATWELRLSSWCEPGIYQAGQGWSSAIRLPRPPVSSIVSVKYLDGDGAEQTVDPGDYETEGVSATPAPRQQRALLFPAYGKAWPTALMRPGAIRIRFASGYGSDAASVPDQLKQGILLRLGELYERREEQTVGAGVSLNSVTARRLWWPFRAF